MKRAGSSTIRIICTMTCGGILSVLNVAGITSPEYHGRLLPFQFGQLIDQVFNDKEPNWRREFCMITSGRFLDSLRKLLGEGMGVANWVEITVGRSREAYAALDFYVRVVSASMRMPDDEAWYLLNTETLAIDRLLIPPEEWYRCTNFLSIGQRPVFQEWYLDATSKKLFFARSRM